MTLEEKEKQIINYYGVLAQLKYFQSEVFELNEAIIKREAIADYEKDYLASHDKHIAEEIADVQLMLNQFKEFYGINDDKIGEIMHFKADRTLERIESGYYKKPEEV